MPTPAPAIGIPGISRNYAIACRRLNSIWAARCERVSPAGVHEHSTWFCSACVLTRVCYFDSVELSQCFPCSQMPSLKKQVLVAVALREPLEASASFSRAGD
jgi:hypothetical protein